MAAAPPVLSVTATELATEPAVAPIVAVKPAAVVPPAVPLYNAVLIAVALAKVAMPRRSVEVAPGIVVETFDLVE